MKPACRGVELRATHPGIYLHGIMSVGHRLASFTRENVVGATSTSGSVHEALDATFDGVGTRSQATALETKVVEVLTGEWPRWNFSLPMPGGELPGETRVAACWTSYT